MGVEAMDTARRTIAKAISWQVLGLGVMTLVGYGLTGSVAQGGRLAVITSLLGCVTYVVHDRIWERIDWGRGRPR